MKFIRPHLPGPPSNSRQIGTGMNSNQINRKKLVNMGNLQFREWKKKAACTDNGKNGVKKGSKKLLA